MNLANITAIFDVRVEKSKENEEVSVEELASSLQTTASTLQGMTFGLSIGMYMHDSIGCS